LVTIDGNVLVMASSIGALDEATAKSLLMAAARGFLAAG
jgi:hypothetical protein